MHAPDVLAPACFAGNYSTRQSGMRRAGRAIGRGWVSERRGPWAVVPARGPAGPVAVPGGDEGSTQRCRGRRGPAEIGVCSFRPLSVLSVGPLCLCGEIVPPSADDVLAALE